MRQLIARIDDDLHARLKERASDEGRSLNALVQELLTRGVTDRDARERLRTRLTAADLRIVPPQPPHAPSRAVALGLTRGAGDVASAALATERGAR